MLEYRLFISIDLSADVKESLGQVQAGLKTAQKIKWVAPNNFHLTVQFLGNTPANKVDHILHALQKAASNVKPFQLTLAKLGCFPNKKRPTVLWVGIKGDTDTCKILFQDVAESMKQFGFSPDKRGFKPHLTIARTSKSAKLKDYQHIQLLLKNSHVGHVADIFVTEICLMRSVLKTTGPVYTTLGTCPL